MIVSRLMIKSIQKLAMRAGKEVPITLWKGFKSGYVKCSAEGWMNREVFVCSVDIRDSVLEFKMRLVSGLLSKPKRRRACGYHNILRVKSKFLKAPITLRSL